MAATGAEPAPPPPRPEAAKVRVLVPYLATFPGGVRTVLAQGLPRLARTPGLDVTYAELCRNHADMDPLERAGVAVDRTLGLPGTAVLSGRRGRLAGLVRHAPRLARLALRLARRLGAFDVVYLHGHRELLLAAAARALLPPGRRPALVWHWHGPPLSLEAGERGGRGDRLLARLGSATCARVIAVSDFCARQCVRMGVDPARVATVPNAAEASSAELAAPLPARRPGDRVALLACASLRPHKGVHVAIEALGSLPAHHALWVTGDPDDRAARDYVADLRGRVERAGLGERVTFLGVRRDLPAVMARADAVLVPSTWDEPFGLVAAEAQLASVPVVAARRGALPEIARDGELGLLADPDDPATFAAALLRLEREPGLAGRLAHAARREAAARYGHARWTAEIAAVIAAAAATRRSRRSSGPR